jgi:6-phosphofructokinase 1
VTEHKLAILVGGGPAPGINSVIGAATIRARVQGVEVLGIRDGFEWIMQGDIDHVVPLDIDDVSRIHFRGGSHIGISRANPTSNPEHLENALLALMRLGVSQLITIGGDDTAFSAMKLEEEAAGRLQVVHVPKTIDNDLDLPPHVDTFGYQTARHLGVDIVKNLMVDARTTSRWYYVIAMGRKAGHLALGIGKAVGATITLIPEEFGTRKVRLKPFVDTLAGSIVKRLSYGRRDGVAIIAEGLVLRIDPQDMARVDEAERDAHGNLRIDEVNIGELLKEQVRLRVKELGIKTTIVAKNIGYELRCADPVPFDMEYTRDLGYCAAKHLFSGGNADMISIEGGHFVPIPFRKLLDPETGRTKVRMVDVHSTRYAIARRYMIRLRRDDFQDPHELAKLAATCGLSPEEFRREFEYLVEDEPPALVLEDVPGAAAARPARARRPRRPRQS